MTKSRTSLTHSYFLYAALLALKLLAFIPLSAIVSDPVKLQRANLSDLKNLTPFWLVAALYTTTAPDVATAVSLFRVYFLARCVTGAGYVWELPRSMIEGAFFVSFAITGFMGASVVYAYRDAF